MVRMLPCRGYAIAPPPAYILSHLQRSIKENALYPARGVRKEQVLSLPCEEQKRHLYIYTQSGTRRDDAYHSLCFVDKADNACKKEPRRGDGRQAGVKPLLSIRKKEKPRRGDRPQAGVKPLINMRKKEKPRRGDGTAAYPLSFRHSSGVLMERTLSYRGCTTAYPCLRSFAPLGLLDKNLLSRTRVENEATCSLLTIK